MIREALIASHTANGFTGQNTAIVTQFETEIIRQTAWNGLIFSILIYFLRHVRLLILEPASGYVQ